MSIVTRCGTCQKTYKVADEWAGRKIRCKHCQGIVVVPAAPQAQDPPPAPTRAPAKPAAKPAARPTATPQPPADSSDPFADLDSLMSLEQSGTVVEPEPPRRGRYSSAAPDISPAAPPTPRYQAPHLAGAMPAAGVMAAPEFRPRHTSQTFRMPGEDAIDSWIPKLAFILYAIAVVYPIAMLIQSYTGTPADIRAPIELFWRTLGQYLGYVLGATAVVVGVAALIMLAIHVSASIMKFTKPDWLFGRCVAMVLLPYAASVVIVWKALFDHKPPLVPYLLLFPMCIVGTLVLLLLLTRLRPAAYLTTAGFTVVFAVVLPLILFWLYNAATSNRSSSYHSDSSDDSDRTRRTVTVTRSGSEPPQVTVTTTPRPAAPGAVADPSQARATAEARLKRLYASVQAHASEHNGEIPISLLSTNLDLPSRNSPSGVPFIYNPHGARRLDVPADVILAHGPLGGAEHLHIALFANGNVVVMASSEFASASAQSSQAAAQSRMK